MHEWTQGLVAQPSAKRLEENVKFVYKSALKHLRAGHAAAVARSAAAPDFYAHYFGAHAAATGVPLRSFFDPLNARTPHKTLTHEYLSLVLRAPPFRAAFSAYVRSDALAAAYAASVPHKLSKLLLRFDARPADAHEESRALHSARHYFRRNKQCKLPWSEAEVASAVACMRQLCE